MALEASDGDAVGAVGVEACELQFIAGHALNLNIDEAGFGGSLTSETPEGTGHFCDQDVFDEVGGFPGFEVHFDEFLEFGDYIAGRMRFRAYAPWVVS